MPRLYMPEQPGAGLRTRRHIHLRLIVLFAATASVIHPATLSAPDQTANAGDTVLLSLSLSSPDQPLSGVQFDLNWDPALGLHMTPGAQAAASNKVLYTWLLQPRLLRCLIVGTNNNTLADGELMRLFVTVNSASVPSVSLVKLLNLSATSASGLPAFLQGGNTAVTIQAGSATQFLQPSGVLNAGSLAAGPVSPGEIITLFGSISAASPAVLVNGVPAPIIYAGSGQVNAIVPFGLDLSGPAQVEIQQGPLDIKISIPVAAASPSIFTLNATGTGPGAILNQDYSVNSPLNPAPRGSAIMIFATGFGALKPLPPDGQIAQVLATTASPVTATIDGVPADVFYAGAAPQLINGAVQVNVRIPNGVNPNPAAPISLSMGSFTTSPGVTVSIK